MTLKDAIETGLPFVYTNVQTKMTWYAYPRDKELDVFYCDTDLLFEIYSVKEILEIDASEFYTRVVVDWFEKEGSSSEGCTCAAVMLRKNWGCLKKITGSCEK